MDSNLIAALIIALGRAGRCLLRPVRSGAKLMIDAASDLTRTRSELITESALLRQHLIVLRRSLAVGLGGRYQRRRASDPRRAPP